MLALLGVSWQQIATGQHAEDDAGDWYGYQSQERREPEGPPPKRPTPKRFPLRKAKVEQAEEAEDEEMEEVEVEGEEPRESKHQVLERPEGVQPLQEHPTMVVRTSELKVMQDTAEERRLEVLKKRRAQLEETRIRSNEAKAEEERKKKEAKEKKKKKKAAKKGEKKAETSGSVFGPADEMTE